MTIQKKTEAATAAAAIPNVTEAEKNASRVLPLSAFPYRPTLDVKKLRQVVTDVQEKRIRGQSLVAGS